MPNPIIPVFENGRAVPVFPFTDGTAENYCPETSSIVRFCVYIETDYDMDGDGKRDLVKAFIQVPRSAAEGTYKAPALYEARPYCSGTNADAFDHMKEVENINFPPYDLKNLDHPAAPRTPSGFTDTMSAALNAKVSDWHFPYAGNHNSFCYGNIDIYDYYLIRGFAVVLCSGFGTYGSDGIEYVGSHYERDAFKSVVEWLHGDRTAYTDRTQNTAIRADWCSGKVAMTGRSYAGTMPFAVAVTGVPGLETIIPVAGIADWYSQQNMQGAQRYWPKEMLNSFLSYYCSSQYREPDLSAEKKDQLDRFFHQISLNQLKSGCDYSDFWKDGNYTLDAEKIRCSALIVHGLHDENVSTKQFEMMLHSFQKAKAHVKLLLHQGPHITPTMPDRGYGIEIGDQFYDDIVNEWLCHYLFGLENEAQNRPAVFIQSNLDQTHWISSDCWNTQKSFKIFSLGKGISILDSEWDSFGVTADNFDEKMSTASSKANRRFLSETLPSPLTIQGSVCASFSAALSGGNPKTHFDPSNPNDADLLTMRLASSSGKQDDMKLCLLLCDVASETFSNIAASDPQRNIIPVKTVKKEGLSLGGPLPALDICRFETVNTPFHVITRAYTDLCNPDSGYEPESAAASISLEKGIFHDYHVFFNAARYTLVKGHRLALVIATEDPVNCLVHKKYQVEILNSSLEAVIPTAEDFSEKLFFQLS